MRLTTTTFALLACSVLTIAACSSDDDTTTAPAGNTPAPSGGDSPNGSTPSGEPGAAPPVAAPGQDPPPNVPAIQLVGRFDASSTKTAWPGGRIVARFKGTGANATFSQLNGLSGGNSWLNVVVDGQVTKKVEVLGSNLKIALAADLPAGEHVVEIEKRTEPNRGTIVFEGFDFPGGELLPPPPRKSRRIEYLSDSTIDGFGVDGQLGITCQDGAPVSLDDVRKSVSAVTSSLLDAESHVIAYSGKGVVRNENGTTADPYPSLYVRALPDVADSAWDFASWTPDAVVISLGGSDLTLGSLPDGFQSAYDALVTGIRGRHPNAHIYMTVWSQIKDLGAGRNIRTELRTALDGVKAAHASDAKLHVFVWNEADYDIDETGCMYHANEAHGVETANELAPVIKQDLGW